MAKKKFNADYDNAVGPEIEKIANNDGLPAWYKMWATILLIIGAIGCMYTATYYFADEMNYDPALGEKWLFGTYPFWNIILWQDYYKTAQQAYLDSITLGINFLLPIFGILMWMKFNATNKLKGDAYLHGSARWANRKDIEKMGLLPHHFTFSEKINYYVASYLKLIFITLVTFTLAYWLYKLKGKYKNIYDIKKLKDQNPEGVFVGAWYDKTTGETSYLRHNGPEHVLCVAPTRSGKGVGLVNPTLLTWRESTFVMDLKGELWALTSGWRSKYAHNKCIRFEPACPRRCVDEEKKLYNVSRWNPFDEIRSEGSKQFEYDYRTKKLIEVISDGEQEIADVQNIATLMVDPNGEGMEGSDGHWKKTAWALLVGCIIHLKHNCPDRCNISTLDMMLAGQIDTAALRQKNIARLNGDEDDSDDNRDSGESSGLMNLWDDMKKGLDINGKEYKARDAVITAGSDMINRPQEEAGSVLSTATTCLSLYRDPIVAKNTEVSDFRIKQFMNLEEPVSIYCVTQPADKLRLKPLVRLLVNLVVRLLADKMEFEKGRSVKGYMHKILLMLDEFPSLGKLDIMQESLAFVAGYGIKAYLITQDMSQLFTLYGKDESISSNCHVSNFYAPLRTDTAEIMSKKCGTTTIVKENVSLSGTGFKTSKSRSISENSRPLLTADECMQLPGPEKNFNGDIQKPGKMLIFVAGFPAIYGVQPLYFKDPVLLHRAQVDAPKSSDVILDKDGLKNLKTESDDNIFTKREKVQHDEQDNEKVHAQQLELKPANELINDLSKAPKIKKLKKMKVKNA